MAAYMQVDCQLLAESDISGNSQFLSSQCGKITDDTHSRTKECHASPFCIDSSSGSGDDFRS